MVDKQRVYHVTEMVFQVILVTFVVLVMWEILKIDTIEKHRWHVICVVLGVALLMAEGVQLFRSESTVTYGDTREEKRKIHILVMVVSFILVTIGISLKISQKEDTNRSHFDSIHGSLGLSAWILAFFTAIGGMVAADIIPTGISGRVRKLLHIIFGVCSYIIAIFALGYGLKYLIVGDNGRIFLYILLAIYSLYSLIGPCTTVLNLIKS